MKFENMNDSFKVDSFTESSTQCYNSSSSVSERQISYMHTTMELVAVTEFTIKTCMKTVYGNLVTSFQIIFLNIKYGSRMNYTNNGTRVGETDFLPAQAFEVVKMIVLYFLYRTFHCVLMSYKINELVIVALQHNNIFSF